MSNFPFRRQLIEVVNIFSATSVSPHDHNNKVPNIDKTVYCHFADNPIVEPIEINDVTLIKGVKLEKGHKYLGVKFYPTNDFDAIIRLNLKERKGSISKCYAWLNDNITAPIEIKVLVLDNCMMSSILYSVEAWGDITCIEKELRIMERKALKAILRVKKST